MKERTVDSTKEMMWDEKWRLAEGLNEGNNVGFGGGNEERTVDSTRRK